MEKYKYILTAIITLCTITTYAQPAQYTPMTAAGYQMKRLKVDSTLHLPSFCGVPTIRGSVAKDGALAIDTCGGLLYIWTRTAGWDTVNTSSGGGSTDTTSLSNRINLKIDSLKRSNDSVYAFINGTKVFQFKDSVGGGGTTPTLQQVTDAGSTTTNTITTASLNLSGSLFPLTLSGNSNDGSFVITNTGTTDELLSVTNGLNGFLKFGGGAGQFVVFGTSPIGNVSLQAPGASGTIPLSVNGNTADLNGNITISTGGVAVDTIFRKLGKDSIFYKKNNITYAIKDSVGTNPAPVGYYGAFQDTTTQTALVTNTAYGVKLGVTDLTNGVTVANNSKIKIANAGIYNIQFSLQLEKTGGSGNMIADIWLRKNNVNLAGTNGKIVLTGSANASPIVAAWNYVVAVSSNDSLELMWATDNLNVKIISDVATSPHPSTPSAILTVTQQSGIMAGTGISPLDTANMLSNYARKNLVNTKLNISDTSTLQTKSISSYSILANNTSATANATAQAFRDTTGIYNGTITWTGTLAPSGATNHSYRITQVGKCVTININLLYATNGTGLNRVVATLPSGAPTPAQPTGLTSALQNIYVASAQFITSTNTTANLISRNLLRNNTANNGFEFSCEIVSATAAQVNITCQYWTN